MSPQCQSVNVRLALRVAAPIMSCWGHIRGVPAYCSRRERRICPASTRNPVLREDFLRDPKGELARYPRKLTADERTALLAGDVGKLYQMGVNPYLMGYLARYGLFGLTGEMYSTQVRTSEDNK